MAENLERYRKYEAIFAFSGPLRESLEKVYADIYKFTVQIGSFYCRSGISMHISLSTIYDVLTSKEYCFQAFQLLESWTSMKPYQISRGTTSHAETMRFWPFLRLIKNEVKVGIQLT